MITSDHGEMLGERGLWYKMSFFERPAAFRWWCMRPAVSRRAGWRQSVSSVDLLPTLVELAVTARPRFATAIEGRSLLPHLEGTRRP